MRFSLQSLAICLLSAQARVALAGPCRPLTTTSVGATTTTTSSKEASTTATLSEEPTTTIQGGTSTVVVSDVPTTTTTLSEELATTTAVETTTALETTTAAETTTTTLAPEPSLYARYDDGTEVGVYLGSSDFVGTEADDSVKADFALETDTSRLYVTLSDGSKLYAVTVIPTGGNYGFLFDTYEHISEYPNLYHFITCTTDSELYLTCSSEGGPTPIYWYKPSSSTNFYGNSNSATASSFGNVPASFRLPRAL